MTDSEPLILTLLLDDALRERFDTLRRIHFPAERNFLTAHVTAFHALPGDLLDIVVADVRASAPAGPVVGSVTGVRFLGSGVAYDLSVRRGPRPFGPGWPIGGIRGFPGRTANGGAPTSRCRTRWLPRWRVRCMSA